ncbi:exopolysaccharide biosynthesis protein [Hydrogenophaga sp.]|uniref:exopolysaccharide biosynthesis protein n=1 Tax=Hydrogenophaga sp. TaxID=1904254 RepID=UPI003F6E8578
MSHVLSEVLDQLDRSIDGDSVSVEQILEALGERSFASLLLIFPLIAVSPASAVPGVTAGVAVIVFLLVGQMILGRKYVWLPSFVRRRCISSAALRKGTGWLRKPVAFVERGLKSRLTFLVHRPWLYVPLCLILLLSMFMPFMELIPTSGSIASAIIALFAAGLLTRDGAVVLVSLLLLSVLPMLFWQVATNG